MDFLLDHADEVLLSGLVARECLAALNVDVGKGVSAEPSSLAKRLMAKVSRRKVTLRCPATTRRGY